MTSDARAPRGLGLVCAGLGGAAALLWAASATVWYVVTPPGRPAVALTGADVSAAPEATALLALAGVAAVVAIGGLSRRLIGLLFAVAGIAVGVLAVRAWSVDPFATDATSGPPHLPPGVAIEALRQQPTDTTAAPLLAVAGAVLLLGAGVFVLLREPRLARMGGRYGRARPDSVDPDPDRSAWRELDAGRDPTVDLPAGGGEDLGESGRNSTV